jgi:type I restriction enzyme, S subunit
VIATNTVASRAFAIWWKDLERWDVKFFSARVRSSYPVVRLAPLIHEHSERVKPFGYPETTFRILGVNNTGGIFHAYDSLGKKIKQLYQKVDAGDFAYNPYRVNVGSIGVVPTELGGNYISPAYVVFATDKTRLLADYLILLLKADWFNPMIRAATAGSVRQNLTFDLLGTLEIPLPPLAEQQVIVARWHKAQDEIAVVRERVVRLEAKLPLIVYRELGTPPPLAEKATEKSLVMWWKDLERWSFNYLTRAIQGLLGFAKSKFPIETLGNHLIKTMNGYCIKPVAEPTLHKMLKLNALNPAGLDLTASKFVKISDKIAKHYSINKGDLFICRSVGSYDHVAKCALATEDAPNIVFPDIMIRVQVKDSLLPEYVREVVQTPLGRSFFKSNARTAVGMWKIGAEDISNFPIPVPPLAVQRQIVDRMTAERAEIAREREAADSLAREINAEIENLILGTKKVNEL